MSRSATAGVDRRRFLLGGTAVGAGTLLVGCTSNEPRDDTGGENENQVRQQGKNSEPGKEVTIGFSAPAADHGWMAAISKNAREQADQFEDVDLQATEGTNDVNAQISAVRTLIDRKVGVLVILPFDGKALTSVAQNAMDANIPVVNLDRVFSSKLAYRTWVGGDNYGMGVNAGHYVADRLKQEGKSGKPVIVEVAGIDNLELTQERSQGFKEALKSHNLKVTARQAADFTAANGRKVMANLLQAHQKIDAVWNHDDDQGIGVEAAIKQAGRDKDEFFMVGGAGSAHVIKQIQQDNSVIKATVLYPPTMAASAISLARLVGQGRALEDFAEREVPASVTTYSAVVTKKNAAQYLPLGF